jgi:hypothetical protein
MRADMDGTLAISAWLRSPGTPSGLSGSAGPAIGPA